MKVLILSDGRMGHLNQSIAFVKHLNVDHKIINISFTCKICKILSYIFDFFGIYIKSLFKLESPINEGFTHIVSAGSSTYYANKTLSKQLGLKSVTMMLPKGYRYNFDTIFAQSHDNPPNQPNIIELPANFSHTTPKRLFTPSVKSIGIIIGGNNSHFKINEKSLKKPLDFIFERFKDYNIAVTTSPRTPKVIEELLENYPFAYKVIFSQNPINPIADFLHHCERVFITIDSTSMISEAISYGTSHVEVLPLGEMTDNKFFTMAKKLESQDFLHIFNGTCASNNRKIDFLYYAQKALI